MFLFFSLQSTAKVRTSDENRLPFSCREFIEPSQLAGESMFVPVVYSNDGYLCSKCEGRDVLFVCVIEAVS